MKVFTIYYNDSTELVKAESARAIAEKICKTHLETHDEVFCYDEIDDDEGMVLDEANQEYCLITEINEEYYLQKYGKNFLETVPVY